MDRMNKDELLALIEKLKVNKEEYVILSSSALVLRGIYESAGDLDLAVTKKGLQELKENYNVIPKERGWYTVTDKIECIECDMPKEKVNGYYVQDINDYLEYLEGSSREKDKLRIPLVKEYIKNR
jgi:hypothetical protein